MARVRLDEEFGRSYRKLGADLQRATDQALIKLQEHPPRPSLHLERIKGTDAYWSIKVNKGYRVLLRLETDAAGEVFAVLEVGPHDSYRRWG